MQKVKGIAGSERYFLDIIPALTARGVYIEFLVLDNAARESSVFIELLRSHNITVHRHLLVPLSPISLSFKINKLINSGNFDILHTHLIHADLYAGLYRLLFRTRTLIVSTKHGYDEKYQSKYGLRAFAHGKSGLFYGLAKFAEKQIDFSFAVSKGLSDLYFQLGICAERLPVIWHGIKRRDILAENSNEEHAANILIVGRLIPFKGHLFLLEALKSIASPFVLHVAGDGNFKSIINEKAKQYGLEDRVVFHGHLPDVSVLYAQCDFAVVPSIGEGFGLVVIEAFSHGKPVVAFDVPALNELITDGADGVLVPPFEIEKLTSAIQMLIDDKEKLKAMQQNALQKAYTQFDFQRTVEQTLQFYQQCLHLKSDR
jgi:glycosyltransferase involved in cell wall biosynthesis